MGYEVYYQGELEISPPLSEEHAALVLAFSKNERTEATRALFESVGNSEEPDLPAYGGLFDISEERDRILPEEEESRHGLRRWLALLSEHFFQSHGYVLNGEITWHGEDLDDRGTIFVKDNAVEAVDDVVVNPGPSWAPESFADRKLRDSIHELLETESSEGCTADLTVVSVAPIASLRDVLPKLDDFVGLMLD